MNQQRNKKQTCDSQKREIILPGEKLTSSLYLHSQMPLVAPHLLMDWLGYLERRMMRLSQVPLIAKDEGVR
jgi:hypothetical protein